MYGLASIISPLHPVPFAFCVLGLLERGVADPPTAPNLRQRLGDLHAQEAAARQQAAEAAARLADLEGRPGCCLSRSGFPHNQQIFSPVRLPFGWIDVTYYLPSKLQHAHSWTCSQFHFDEGPHGGGQSAAFSPASLNSPTPQVGPLCAGGGGVRQATPRERLQSSQAAVAAAEAELTRLQPALQAGRAAEAAAASAQQAELLSLHPGPTPCSTGPSQTSHV